MIPNSEAHLCEPIRLAPDLEIGLLGLGELLANAIADGEAKAHVLHGVVLELQEDILVQRSVQDGLNSLQSSGSDSPSGVVDDEFDVLFT